jgi:hypothetical protein
MPRRKFIMVKISMFVFTAELLVLLQIAAVYGATSLLPPSPSHGSPDLLKSSQCCTPVFLAPISTSGNNVYVTWSSNKTGGNFEVMFRASTDNGKTFGSKINLSNSPGVDSVDPSIAASGNNVYVSWWEIANQTSNEPIMRVSHDDGKTFGPVIMLSSVASSSSGASK